MQAVLFDLFGTLIPNLTPIAFREATTSIAGILGGETVRVREVIKTQLQMRMTGEIPDGPRQFERLADEVGREVSDEALATAATVWRGLLTADFHPKPDALATLRSLRERGLRLGLATDCSTETKADFEASPLAEHFEACAYSSWLGVTKPAARMYRHVLDQLEIEPERCSYVGDGNSHELRGARALGMRTIWVDNGEEQHVRHRFDQAADHAVTHLGQLLDLDWGAAERPQALPD